MVADGEGDGGAVVHGEFGAEEWEVEGFAEGGLEGEGTAVDVVAGDVAEEGVFAEGGGC